MLLMRHENATNGYFSQSVVSTGIENPEYPSANTYCIIGSVDPAMFQLAYLDGWYELELIYERIRDRCEGCVAVVAEPLDQPTL